MSCFPEKKSNNCWPRELYLIWGLPMSASLFTTLLPLSAFQAHGYSLFPAQALLLFVLSAWSAWTRLSVVGSLLSYEPQLQCLLLKEASLITRNSPSLLLSLLESLSSACLQVYYLSFSPLRDRFPDSRDLSV